MGGPGVFPPVPAGISTELSATAAAGGWRTEKDPAQTNRRSVYIFVRRNLRYPMMQEFDSANTFESCDYRKNTVTPSQSLDLMNNDLVLDWAQIAGRPRVERQWPDARRADRPRVSLSLRPRRQRRRAKDSRRFSCKSRHRSWRARLATPTIASRHCQPICPQGMDPARAAAFVDLCQMLLDSNEFLYIN